MYIICETWARYIPQLFDIGKNRPQSTSEATHSTPGIAIRRQSFGAIADCRDCRLKGTDGFVTLNVTRLVGDYSCYYRSIVTILSRYLLKIGKNQVTVTMEQIFFVVKFFCQSAGEIHQIQHPVPYICFTTTDSMASSEPS